MLAVAIAQFVSVTYRFLIPIDKDLVASVLIRRRFPRLDTDPIVKGDGGIGRHITFGEKAVTCIF